MATKRKAEPIQPIDSGLPAWRLSQLAENHWRQFNAGPIGIQAWNEGWSSELRAYVIQAAMPAIRSGETPSIGIPVEQIEHWRAAFLNCDGFTAGAMVDRNGNPRPGCEQGVRPWPADYEDWHAMPDPRPMRKPLGDAGKALLGRTIASLAAHGKVKRRGLSAELWPDEPSAITATSAYEAWRDAVDRKPGLIG